MKRFVNNPVKANKKFSNLAYKVNKRNLTASPMRGGTRLT